VPLLAAAAAVWLAVVVLAVRYGPELRWAADALPDYLQDSIGAPVERALYRAAAERVSDDRDLEEARLRLERSIAIDPYSEAVYWLGECDLRLGRVDDALEHFRRYVEIDPTELDAWRRIARIHERRGRTDDAVATLERARDVFERAAAEAEPHPDPTVEDRFNEKAVEVHSELVLARRWIASELERLAAR
jgi:tetratricopeptide (TPR) repeat protein